jgi:hypothetical protein
MTFKAGWGNDNLELEVVRFVEILQSVKYKRPNQHD